MIDIENDTRTCRVCRNVVRFGQKCSCEITQANHLAVVRDARNIAALGQQDTGQHLHVEQYWQESDTQDAPVPLPSLGINWGNTLMVVATCMFLALLLGRCFDGLMKWGSQVNTTSTDIERIERSR